MSLGIAHCAFQAKRENPSPFGRLGQFRARGSADNIHLVESISQGEVQSSLQMVFNNSALGPDGIEKRDILKWDPNCENLTHLPNMCWVTLVIPTRLKKKSYCANS